MLIGKLDNGREFSYFYRDKSSMEKDGEEQVQEFLDSFDTSKWLVFMFIRGMRFLMMNVRLRRMWIIVGIWIIEGII